MTDKDIYSLPHLESISLETLIKETGLYSPMLINTYSDSSRIKYRDGTGKVLPISPDVKQLYSLAFLDKPISLPCAVCKRELAFVKTEEAPKHTGYPVRIPVIREPNTTGASSSPQEYFFGSDILLINPSATEGDYRAVSKTCKGALLHNLQYFSVQLSCTLAPDHNIICFFSLAPFELSQETNDCYLNIWKRTISAEISGEHPSKLSDAEKEAKDLYEIAEHTIVIKKVGQYPSLADMQFFDLKKYQKLLKGSYKELTRAVGLHSAGIGIGAFVYLRRIFESICEDAHQKCVGLNGWSEEAYNCKRFNDKIDYLEKFGETILPDEIASIKAKLYGVLSKGVHEYAEAECQDLFPYLKIAIELILDRKFASLEQQKKISEMAKKIGEAKT